MTSWIFGLIAAILVFGTWWIIRAGRAREHQQALLRQRRDRTGRAMLGSFSTSGTGTQRDAVPRQTVLDHDHSTRAVEHASTLPVSFNNSGGWLSSDYCLPSSADSSNDSPTLPAIRSDCPTSATPRTDFQPQAEVSPNG